MSISHLLEPFAEPNLSIEESADDLRADHDLAIFERGYKEGWEDCDKAAKRSAREIDSEFAQRIRELSFTFHEAHTAMLASLEPFISALLDVMFPVLDTSGLEQHLSRELRQLAISHVGARAIIRCHPERANALLTSLDEDLALAIEFKRDPDLPQSSITIEIGSIEREIDMQDFMNMLRATVAEYFTDLSKESQHD